MCFLLYILAFFPIIVIFLKLFKISFNASEKKSVKNKHVVVTGGSSGIGKAFAILLAKKGAHVTIIARNQGKIHEAVQEIEAARVDTSQEVNGTCLDITNPSKVSEAFDKLENSSSGPIYMLVNCAGLALCGLADEMSEDVYRNLMDVNYFGTVYTIKNTLPHMKRRNDGMIVIVGSQLSLIGMFGFAAYTSSKFALRGLAESLDMELHNYNINVTFSVPPDTDTPGFENENKDKPIETKMICESGGLFDPMQVATSMYDDAVSGRFFSYVGLESALNTSICAGLSRPANLVDFLFEVLFMGTLRALGCYYLFKFYGIVKRCAATKKTN